MKAFSPGTPSTMAPIGHTSGMAAPLPEFLGLGTQKGGTTTLHRLLEQHPDVYLPACKEVHFFDQNHDAGEGWYRGHFTNAEPHQTCGEITPFYLFHPDVPGRIHNLLPKARLVVLLRDPVERTISQLFHARKRGFETLEPFDALAAEAERLQSCDPVSLQKHSYLSRSRYLEQLDRYEALFPREQLLILRSEDLFSTPELVWQQLLSFLALQPIDWPGTLLRANAGDGLGDQIDPALRHQLRQQLAETVAGVRSRYGIEWEWS
ncbi:sulfotransferase [Synechococcus sp. A15-28]|uniref:sulfotransferase family protein n=1 Tax=Synechococcus sp. A15-28 TaxID=1050638 RepID=UPI00164588E5|nr:sulfotransferase [Synechococcus sp. A15-28]